MKKFKFPSAYTVLLAIMIAIALVTQFVPGVKKAQLADVVMAPVTGMVGVQDNTLDEAITTAMDEGGVDSALKTIDESESQYISVWNEGTVKGAIDVSLFVLIVGGFLGVITKTGALDAGVGALVKKLKGKEIISYTCFNVYIFIRWNILWYGRRIVSLLCINNCNHDGSWV